MNQEPHVRDPGRDARRTRPPKSVVDGWVVFDKPVGITSTHAVAVLKRTYGARKTGHAGTLDPLASGILPMAFGEATKTVPWVQDGEKEYVFAVRWGAETDTDDVEGKVVRTSEARPADGDVRAILARFVGVISQVPPSFSAIKVAGERAYDLARDGQAVALAPREVTVHELDVVRHAVDETTFSTRCGKGTYVRALARDMGRALGCLGHVASLRRTRVGPFREADAVSLDTLGDPEAARAAMLEVSAGLGELARIRVDRSDAAILRRGQPILLRGGDAPVEGKAFASCSGAVIAIGDVVRGELVPSRVFTMPF